jgi:hypothetical protein
VVQADAARFHIRFSSHVLSPYCLVAVNGLLLY